MTMTKIEMYVRCRLRGMSDSEACAEAGYEGRPPGQAIKLYRAACKLRHNPNASGWFDNVLQQKRAEVRELELLMRASEFI